MLNKFILFFSFLIILGCVSNSQEISRSTAPAQTNPEVFNEEFHKMLDTNINNTKVVSNGKRKNNKYENSSLQENNNNDLKAFNSDAENTKPQKFSKNFKGDSIIDLIKNIEMIIEKRDDEFTKTSELETKLSYLKSKKYVFLILSNTTYIQESKYNADEEKIKITLRALPESMIGYSSLKEYNYISLISETSSRSFVGMNSFGATTDAQSIHLKDYGIVIDNEGEIFTLSIPVEPKQAKALKLDIAYYVTVDFTNLDLRKDMILDHVHITEATISDPTRISHTLKCIPAKLKEVGVFKKSTGEILGRRIL